MQDIDIVQCNSDFIKDALYQRYEDVKDRWGMEIHNEMIYDFINFVAESGITAGSASEVIDNWLINGESGTYEDVRKYSLNKDDKRTGDDDQLQEVEDYLDYNSYMYDRDLQEYCSY